MISLDSYSSQLHVLGKKATPIVLVGAQWVHHNPVVRKVTK